MTTGVVFGLAHFETLELLGLAAFGVVLSLLAIRFRRLGPCMFAHATFNLLADPVGDGRAALTGSEGVVGSDRWPGRPRPGRRSQRLRGCLHQVGVARAASTGPVSGTMDLMRRPSPPALATFVAVAAVVVIVLWACDPALLLRNSMTTGGDTGAHWGLAQYLQQNLLPHGHVTGWFPGAYDGLPLNTYYFPLPDTLAALLGYVIPFDLAFKFVTILGSITLPIAAWAFGRLAGLERPRPAVLAVATLPFLFDQSFTIYGGNLYSTMAGEYAFSLGLSLSLVFLGLVVRGMRTGRGRVPAVALLAATVLSHLVPTLFAFVGAFAILAFIGPTRRRVWWLASVVGTTFLITAWWALPFLTEQAYSTTMGWQNVTTYAQLLAPHGNWWALALGLVGVVIASVRFCKPILALVVAGEPSVLNIWLAPQTALYNARVLPIWWLCVYLLSGYAVAEILVVAARGWQRLRDALGVAAVPAPPGIHAVRAGRGRRHSPPVARRCCRPSRCLYTPPPTSPPVLAVLSYVTHCRPTPVCPVRVPATWARISIRAPRGRSGPSRRAAPPVSWRCRSSPWRGRCSSWCRHCSSHPVCPTNWARCAWSRATCRRGRRGTTRA